MKYILPFLFLTLSFGIAAAQEKFVAVSDRQLPIAYDVDVLVVGGSTGNIAAAIAAQQAGAKTMLITHRPYLGDDMTATQQLWLEPGEELTDPLAAAIFNDTNRGMPVAAATAMLQAEGKISFTYTIAEPIDPRHPENEQRNKLSDGIASTPNSQSVQINGNATVTLDLQNARPVGVVSLLGYYREAEFVIDSVTVSASNNGTTWREIGTAKLTEYSQEYRDAAVEFRLVFDQPVTTRYLKLDVKKAEAAQRVLLGEIIVLPDKSLIPSADSWIAGPDEKYTHPAPRPMHVKMTLDKALEDAGVKFLYSTYRTGTLLDKDGGISGVIINNRAGRQAILAKRILTVSNSGTGAQQQGLAYQPVTSGVAEFVVVGGEPLEIDAEKFPLLKNASYEIMGKPFYGPWPNRAHTSSGVFPIIKYAFPLEEDTFAKSYTGDLPMFNELEKQIRLATFHPEQQFTSDQIRLKADGVEYLTTTKFIARGREFGASIAKSAAEVGKINPAELGVLYGDARSRGMTGFRREPTMVPGEVRESLANVRPHRDPLGFVKQGEQKIPVVGKYDVVVVGGGTTGAPAGIAAGRQGAKTLVLEYLHDLGGMGTAGAISVYWHGNRVGFTAEVQDGQPAWVIEQRTHWWRSKLAEAGTDTWYGVLGTGAIVEIDDAFSAEPRVKGVIIATPQGPKAVLATVVVDATGNGDIAIAAGAGAAFVDEFEIAVQGHGLPPRHLGASYTNTDYMYVDETDVEDLTHVFVYGKEKFPWAFDFGKIMDTRERRIIIGDFSFGPLDQINKRTYPDTIFRSYSDFDTHGYTTTPFFELQHLHHDRHYADVPLRSSLPVGLESIYVGGLATSCHRDAIPIIRMQPDLQNQGYALGCLAAKAARENVPLRKLDIKPVQEHLVAIGNLPERVLTDKDNYGDSIKDLPDAIKTIPDAFKGTALVHWHPEESLPLLKAAYAAAESASDKLAYAMVLAGLGDPTGAEDILNAVRSFDKWDPGWNFRGMGQFGWASSPLDRYIMMLGRTKDPRGVPVIVEKMKQLEAEDDFSHHRACILALEWIGDKSAASALAEMLKKPGIAGYVHLDWDTARKWDQADPKGGTAEKSRRDSLIEIGYARALFRLGDVDGIGQNILEDYAQDLRGFFSRHANKVLAAFAR